MIEALSAVTLGTHEMGPIAEEQRDLPASDILTLSRPCSVTSRRTQLPFFLRQQFTVEYQFAAYTIFSLEQATPFLENVLRREDGRSRELQRTCHPIPLLSISFRFCGPF